jgi:hypothetical protein
MAGVDKKKRRQGDAFLGIGACAAVISPNLSNNGDGYRGDSYQQKCV